MDGTVILTGIGTVVTIIGANIALISWLRSDMKAFETEVRGWTASFRKDIQSYRDEMAKEMKDFHGRLERQDAEFKSFLQHQMKNKET